MIYYLGRASINESIDEYSTEQDLSESDYNWDSSGTTSLEFWERFLRCIMTLVEEDQVCYGPIFSEVIPDFDVTVCSAEKNWQMLLDDLVGFLEQEQERRQWKSISDYMKLQKLVKEIYERFSVITVKEVHLASYAEYFIPFTNQWLDDCSIEYCKYVEKSYDIDEQDQFSRTNEYVKFSSSVIDLFDMLNQLGASTSKLRSGMGVHVSLVTQHLTLSKFITCLFD